MAFCGFRASRPPSGEGMGWGLTTSATLAEAPHPLPLP